MTYVIGDDASGRDNSFDIIRMLAAMGVLVSHAWLIRLAPGSVQPLEYALHGITLGKFCALIFLAISGFLIAKGFERTSGLSRFVIARVPRLFPVLAVVLCLTIPVAGHAVRGGV